MEDSLIERIRARIRDGQPCDHPGEWLPVLPSVSLHIVADAEAQLGFSLPFILRRLYTDIGNGGFGPVYGLLPLSSESLGDVRPAEAEFDLVCEYLRHTKNRPDGWRIGMVPVFYCGCTVFEFVDCLTAEGAIVPLDLGTDMDSLPPIASLAARLEQWLSGKYPW
jgi:hypothetical protein